MYMPGLPFIHLIHQGYSESLSNGMSIVIKYDRKEMVVLYDFSRRRGGERLRNLSGLSPCYFYFFYLSILMFILIRLYKFKIAKESQAYR